MTNKLTLNVMSVISNLTFFFCFRKKKIKNPLTIAYIYR